MLTGTITVTTSAKIELVDVTTQINKAIVNSGCKEGICYLFNPHTTSAITINEGVDPHVQEDMVAALKKIVPGNLNYKHLEGNSAAHIMTTIVGSSEIVFISDGSVNLGTWQRIFLCEFDGPRSRTMKWRILGA
jgi:secondary thiamine-phosphate synthase enzyme